MRLGLALPLLLSCLTSLGAFACPTCVGPRLGDSGSGELQVSAALRTSVGSDRVGDAVERLEWSNEVAAGVAWERSSVTVAVPVVWRRVGEGTVMGLGDLAARGSFELLRREEPADSDTLRLVAGLGAPTSRGGAAWLSMIGTQSVTPSVAIGWRHSDQDWALAGLVFAAVPFALPGAAVLFGPLAGTGLSAEYQPWRWLTLRLAVDLKHQWAAREAGAVIADSQFFGVFLGAEARWQPARWVAVTGALIMPLVCTSPGKYEHGRIYRLAFELTI